MATLKRLTTMVPFVKAVAGDFFLVRVLEYQDVVIRGETRRTILCDMYLCSKEAPAVDDLVGMLTKVTPQRILFPFNKAIEDAVPLPIKGHPFLTIRYGGQKNLGSKRFNMWDVSELELSVEEKRTLAPGE